MDDAQAAEWAEQAMAGGYHRAVIVKASAGLHSAEVLSGGFPVLKSDVDAQLQATLDSLKAAKKAGVWETFIVAEQLQETINNLAFSEGVMEPFVKAMLAPPPSTPCGPDARDSDGNPISGSGCIGHTR